MRCWRGLTGKTLATDRPIDDVHRRKHTADLSGRDVHNRSRDDVDCRPQLAEAVSQDGYETVVAPFAICSTGEGGRAVVAVYARKSCGRRRAQEGPGHTASVGGYDLKGKLDDNTFERPFVWTV